MIVSLETLAEAGIFDESVRQQFGDKPIDLSEFLNDIDTQKWDVAKPYGHIHDTNEVDYSGLRTVFDDLVSKITTEVEGRKVAGFYLRSAGHKEKSGRNDSNPILYDADHHEASWERFKDMFDEVRHNPDKEGDQVKPVFMQVLQGEVSYTDLQKRRICSFEWQELPNYETHESEWDTIMASISEIIAEGIDEAEVQLPENPFRRISLYLTNEAGESIGRIHVGDKEHITDQIDGKLSSVYDGTRSFVYEEGKIFNDDELLVDIGDKIYVCARDVPGYPVIGETNEGIVARSRDYDEIDRASIRVAKGLTSFLVQSLPSEEEGPMGSIIFYHDAETDQQVDKINLGVNFTRGEAGVRAEQNIDLYEQRHIEVFSLASGEIEAMPYKGRSQFKPLTSDMKKEILKIARHYHEKKGEAVELEGGNINGQLHVWQITESPLADDVITELTQTPEESIIYSSKEGRGTVNFESGDIIIAEDHSATELMRQYDAGEKPYFVLGFSEQTVAGRTSFFHMATEANVFGEHRGLVCADVHRAGYANQVAKEASLEGRQGGVFYVDSPDEFLVAMTPYIQERDGVKVIPNVCVEACREGMQIYKV